MIEEEFREEIKRQHKWERIWLNLTPMQRTLATIHASSFYLTIFFFKQTQAFAGNRCLHYLI